MKGKIEVFSSLDEIINREIDERFTFIIEDYENGLKIKNGDKTHIKNQINSLKEKYGNLFNVRLFNDKKEIAWIGEEGIYAVICEDGEYEVTEKEIWLETDIKRHNGLKSLSSYKKILVQEFKDKKNKIIYRKFKSMIDKGVKDE
ncbi:MAG: hypothetical protein AB1410_10135 [Acidobacteriota bacterium]